LADPKSRESVLEVVPDGNFVLRADMVVKALGQEPLLELRKALPSLKVDKNKVWIDAVTGATTIPKLFAGGDCTRGGGEIVDAVQDGKVAAWGIHEALATDKQR
jgi:glutamate synthase (NADPH/NADH) small chain